MDGVDKKILYELDFNARQSNKQIAKKARVSEMVVSNRIKKLVDTGVIENFYAKLNGPQLGLLQIKTYFRLHNFTKEKEKEIVKEVLSKKGVIWVCSLTGRYDLVVAVLVKNVSEYSVKYEEITKDFSDYILERTVTVNEAGYVFTKAYLMKGMEAKEAKYYPFKDIVELDDINKRLLKILSQDGRMSLIEISKKLDLGPDAVKYRMKNLEQQGIITGYSAKIDFTKLGNSYYIVPIKLQNMNAQKYRRLQRFAQQNKFIIYYIKMIGDRDADLEIEVTCKEELNQLIKDLRNMFVNEIKDYDILEVTKEYVLNYYPF